MSAWPGIIKEIMQERGCSERALVRLSGINRTSLRRCFTGKSPFRPDDLNHILNLLGYELALVPLEGRSCPSKHHPSAGAAKSCASGNDANAEGQATKNATPDTIKPDLPPASGDTIASGTKSAGPTSPCTAAAPTADSPQPWLTISVPTVATVASFGRGATGNPSAVPVTTDASSPKKSALKIGQEGWGFDSVLCRDGEARTVKEWAAALAMHPSNIIQRLQSGWTIKQALTKHVPRVRLYRFRGEVRSVMGWAEVVGLNHKTLADRIARGWTIDRALLTPLQPPFGNKQ